jgi:hypothetical protein
MADPAVMGRWYRTQQEMGTRRLVTSLLGEARARHVLRLSLSRAGQPAAATQAWEGALRIYAGIGAPETAELREAMRSPVVVEIPAWG